AVNRLRNQLTEITWRESILLLSSLNSGEIQHVVNEPCEPSRFGGDNSQVLTPALFVVEPSFGEQFGKHADRRQRCFQFMRNIAHEIRFLARQRELALQVRHYKPASDADGKDQNRDQ